MNDVYFVINGTKLYLDFMLEDINDMPFFYVCKDSTNAKYLVLCTDFDNEEYIIVRITLHDLKDMLYGKMDIRNAFLEKTALTSISILFKNWRFNREIHEVIHPFSLLLCRYNK